MNKFYKKVIAKEFIYLSICVLIILIYGISLKVYAQNKNSRITNELNNMKARDMSILQQIDSLKVLNSSMLENRINFTHLKNGFYYNRSNHLHNIKKYFYVNSTWEVLFDNITSEQLNLNSYEGWSEHDSIFLKASGYKTPQKIEKYILENSLDRSQKISNEIIKKKEVLTISKKKQLYAKQNVKHSDWIFSQLYYFSVVVFLCFFILRYFIYALKWSILTIKQRE